MDPTNIGANTPIAFPTRDTLVLPLHSQFSTHNNGTKTDNFILETAFSRGRTCGILFLIQGQDEVAIAKGVGLITDIKTGRWHHNNGELATGLEYMERFSNHLDGICFLWRTEAPAIHWCSRNQHRDTILCQTIDDISPYNFRIINRTKTHQEYDYEAPQRDSNGFYLRLYRGGDTYRILD